MATKPVEVKTITSFENKDLNWLTYESIYNDAKFRHSDEVCPMGIYRVGLKNLRIIIPSYILKNPAAHPKMSTYVGAFFHSLSPVELQKIAYQPWTDKEGKNDGTYDVNWGKAVVDFTKSNSSAVACMPYIVVNNELTDAENSIAVGSRYSGETSLGEDPNNPDITPLPLIWPMWQTASRSCIIRVLPLKTDQVQQPSVPQAPVPQPPPAADHLAFVFDASTKVANWYFDRSWNLYAPGGNKPADTAFDFLQTVKVSPRVAISECFSVKAGVYYVGSSVQSGPHSQNAMGGKGVLEKDSIVAALRTEYLAALDAKYTSRAKVIGLQNDFAILPECLTVTALKSQAVVKRTPKVEYKEMYNDGFQLRDLAKLSAELKYFPALSVPYVQGSKDLTKFAPQSGLTKDDFDGWDTFWSTNYAARLGKAKALIHILYGFCPLTPNAQNFVIEMKDASKLLMGRTVMRDVLDFRVHTRWARTCLSSDADKDADQDLALSDATKPFKADAAWDGTIRNLFNYEYTTLSPMSKEKGSIEEGIQTIFPADPRTSMLHGSETFDDVETAGTVQFYKGLQLNWFAYSTLIKGTTIAATNPEPANWRRALASAIRWGAAHGAAFVAQMNAIKDIKVTHNGADITADYLMALKVDVTIDGKPETVILKNLETDVLDDKKVKTAQDADGVQKRLEPWDRAVSKIVEDGIYTVKANRDALRAFVRGTT